MRAGAGVYFGEGARTNNVAETKTMLVALKRIKRTLEGAGCKGLTVYSDSDLLVRFVTRRARPRDTILMPMVAEIR